MAYAVHIPLIHLSLSHTILTTLLYIYRGGYVNTDPTTDEIIAGSLSYK